MPTLSLLRHAKSSWTAAGAGNKPVADKDRPLSSRGERDMPRMAAWMATNLNPPDLVICSTAMRTRQTLQLAQIALGTAGRTPRMSDELYLAEADDMLAMARALPDSIGHAMFIGHDPGTHELAMLLSGAGNPAQLNLLATKFPTAGLVTIDFQVPWAMIAPGNGTLRLFMAPKRLPA